MKISNIKDQRDLLLGSNCKANNLTSNYSMLLEMINLDLEEQRPLTEASLHCISYKLSKPRSQLKFFPTCHKTVKHT